MTYIYICQQKKIQLNLTIANNNFNERTNNTLNQQQDAINKTLDNTLNNVKIQLMKLYMKFHDIHNVLLNIKNRLFKL